MASRVDLLVTSLLQTDGDALYIVPGERLFMTRGGVRAVVGREPVGAHSFDAIVAELAPGRRADELARARYRMALNVGRGAEPVDIQFGIIDGAAAVMICRASRMGGSPEPAAPEPLPAPESIVVPVTPRPAPPPSAAAREAISVAGDRALERLLLRLREAEGSDLHLATGLHPLFRIDGEVVAQEDLPVLSADALGALLAPILSEEKRAELEERRETSFACDVAGVARVRVSVFRDRGGPGTALRLVPFDVPTPSQLGLPDAAAALADLPAGLVIVTGPAGSGRSTTLAALLGRVNATRAAHVVTVEDPVEHVHADARSHVSQREVGASAASLAGGLRSALRADPDVVLISDLRDLEATELALEAAESGRLVLSALFAPTAVSAIERLVDRFPADRQRQARALLGETLKGVVSQALCRKAGGGRIAAFEVLLVNPAAAGLVRDGKTSQLPALVRSSRAEGMVLLNDALLELVKSGLVEPGEAYRKSVDRSALLGAFLSNGLPLPAEIEVADAHGLGAGRRQGG